MQMLVDLRGFVLSVFYINVNYNSPCVFFAINSQIAQPTNKHVGFPK